jgi:adenosine deaminase
VINLHTHLEGRVRPATAAELAPALGLGERDWARALQLDAPADLTAYLDRVAASFPFLSTPETLARVACEAVEDAAADGVTYLELRLGPATHARPGHTELDVVRSVCEGVREGLRGSGIEAGLVVAALRTKSDESNLAVARAAAAAAGDGVVGFDLAGNESRRPELEPFAGAFAIARAAGLGLTCHAAEAGPASAAREAVERFGVTRIGHGTHIADDPEILRWAADSGVVVEVCPTSNWFTGAIARVADHPALFFVEHGVRIVLGDDNPVPTGSPLSRERAVLGGLLGDAYLAELDRVSEAAAFR